MSSKIFYCKKTVYGIMGKQFIKGKFYSVYYEGNHFVMLNGEEASIVEFTKSTPSLFNFKYSAIKYVDDYFINISDVKLLELILWKLED